MFRVFYFLLIAVFVTTSANGKDANDDVNVIETPVTLETTTGNIYGTLTNISNTTNIPVALIIAGSGPTDRDGNNPMMKNDCLKQLAHQLADHNIASLRYDKRGIAASKDAGKNEADLRFEDYVHDAQAWIELLKNRNQFSKIIIIGHSEGSLIGMMAATNADKFISIAGVGQPADKTLKEQLGKQPPMVQEMAFPIIDSLKQGHRVENVNPILNSLFRPSVQPYIISWFKYDPQDEIKKLKIPILILQGTKDLQVTERDARRLHEANENSKLVLIQNMNHVLKSITGDQQENLAAYNNKELPIAAELVDKIVPFISIKK